MFDHLFSIRVFFTRVQMFRKAYIANAESSGRIEKPNNYEVRVPKMTTNKKT